MRKLAFVGMTARYLGVLALAAAPALATAASSGKSYTMSLESSASETAVAEGTQQTVVNTTFAFSSLYNPKKQNQTEEVLLSQRIESTSIAGREGAEAKLETTAWVDGKGKYDSKLWTINDCADTGWRAGDFYLTSKYGMSGSENLLRAYNFTTGKYAFTYTAAPATAEIFIPKDVVKRHFAYVSKMGSDSACRKNDMPSGAIGVLVLSDGNNQLDRLLFESPNGDLARSPRVVLVDKKETKGATNLMVWGPAEFGNKSDVVKGFAVKLLFPEGVEVTVPVLNDKFDLDRTSVPISVKMRRIDVEKGDGGK